MGEERKRDESTPVGDSAETEGLRRQPGHIPEPKEKDWTSEAADPYEKIDRADPFEGRPETEVPQPSENIDEQPAAGPGQPKE